MSGIGQYVFPVIMVILGIIALYLLIFKVFGLTIIGTNEVGVVEKWWSPKEYSSKQIP